MTIHFKNSNVRRRHAAKYTYADDLLGQTATFKNGKSKKNNRESSKLTFYTKETSPILISKGETSVKDTETEKQTIANNSWKKPLNNVVQTAGKKKGKNEDKKKTPSSKQNVKNVAKIPNNIQIKNDEIVAKKVATKNHAQTAKVQFVKNAQTPVQKKKKLDEPKTGATNNKKVAFKESTNIQKCHDGKIEQTTQNLANKTKKKNKNKKASEPVNENIVKKVEVLMNVEEQKNAKNPETPERKNRNANKKSSQPKTGTRIRFVNTHRQKVEIRISGKKFKKRDKKEEKSKNKKRANPIEINIISLMTSGQWVAYLNNEELKNSGAKSSKQEVKTMQKGKPKNRKNRTAKNRSKVERKLRKLSNAEELYRDISKLTRWLQLNPSRNIKFLNYA